MKKSIYIGLIAILIITIISLFWSIVSGGYDKQNKTILYLKKIIPSKLARSVRDTIFIIPNLQEENKVLSLQVKKYEQGYDGDLFFKEVIRSEDNVYEFELKKFFLPFKRLDLNLGWKAEENSKRAHYLEIVDDKIFVISGTGKTIFFEKFNINKNKLNQVLISNNIEKIFNDSKNKFYGVRDLFYEDNYLYISVLEGSNKGFTINIYRAEKNFNNLKFDLFFQTNEFAKNYNLQTGGRIESFNQKEILFSVGFLSKFDSPQDKKSVVGKIISINKTTKEPKIISLGHRNPQGLLYLKEKKLIVNTEHGPKGGDEINLNFLLNSGDKNYGWPISSYGEPYSKQAEPFYKKNGYLKKSHEKYNFIEPFKYFTPSIGISEIIFLKEDNKNNFLVSSLRAASIYIMELDNQIKKINNMSRLYLGNTRIRDLKYDRDNGVIFMVLENTPAIGILKRNKS